MGQKGVSFKVAKAIKEAGYPQNDLSVWYDSYGTIFTIYPKEGTEYYVAPSYMETWLWLWREKKIYLEIENLHTNGLYTQHGCVCGTEQCGGFYTTEVADPEEAIIAAIDYLVNENLLK